MSCLLLLKSYAGLKKKVVSTGYCPLNPDADRAREKIKGGKWGGKWYEKKKGKRREVKGRKKGKGKKKGKGRK